MIVRIQRLLKRPEFLAAAKAFSYARGAVVIQDRDRKDGQDHIGEGFTATKKIGGAVERNRAKRRLREAARQLLPLYGQAGHDYVLVARSGTTDREWHRLLDDVKTALIRLQKGEGQAARPYPAKSGARSKKPHPGAPPKDQTPSGTTPSKDSL